MTFWSYRRFHSAIYTVVHVEFDGDDENHQGEALKDKNWEICLYTKFNVLSIVDQFLSNARPFVDQCWPNFDNFLTKFWHCLIIFWPCLGEPPLNHLLTCLINVLSFFCNLEDNISVTSSRRARFYGFLRNALIFSQAPQSAWRVQTNPDGLDPFGQCIQVQTVWTAVEGTN